MAGTAAQTSSATPSEAKPLMNHRQILLVIYGLMAGMFLSALDQTIVGTAIRTIGDDLHGLDQQAWVTTAYLITSTVTTPVYGKLSDVFGRRPLYLFGIIVFVVGSLLSSFSTSMLMLAGFRAFQGIGAGALMSLPLAIMGDILAPRERAKYQGYFLAVFGVSSLVGPLVGGLFAGADEILWIAGWRWVFLINVPVGLIAVLMVLRFLHLPRFAHDVRPRIDWWGAALVVVTLVPLLLVAEQGRTWGWTSPAAVACYAVGLLGLAAFLIVETRMGADAIIPLRLFRNAGFSMSTVLGFFVGFGMFGAMLTLPLYMQIVLGLSPTESGFAMLPMVLGLMISSILVGQVIARTGRYRIFPRTGTAFVAGGFVMLTFLTADRPFWFMVVAMFITGLGFGQLMQSLTLATQSAVQAKDMGVATSAATFFRQIGGTLGTAVLLSVLFTVMPGNITQAMSDKQDLTAGLDAALTPATASAARNAGAMREIWTPIVTPITAQLDDRLAQATTAATTAAQTAVTEQVTAAVAQQVAAGAIGADQAQGVIDAQVAAALPAATETALAQAATQADVSVIDGRLAVDWADTAQREQVVSTVVPTIVDTLSDGTGEASGSSDASISDTSFLTGADRALVHPFLVGFTTSAVTVYWVGLAVMLLAFLLTLLFRPAPLRQRSALEERAEQQRDADAEEHPAGQDRGVAVGDVTPGSSTTEQQDGRAGPEGRPPPPGGATRRSLRKAADENPR